MKNEEILKRALKRSNLWLPKYKEPLDDYIDFLLEDNEYYKIIFSHEFAKSFWGSGLKEPFPKTKTWWQHHLQQMVLEEDPIKYLERFI